MSKKNKGLTETQLQKKILIEEYFSAFITDGNLQGKSREQIVTEWKELAPKMEKKSVDSLTEECQEYVHKVNNVSRYLSLVQRNRAQLGYDAKQVQTVIDRERESVFG